MIFRGGRAKRRARAATRRSTAKRAQTAREGRSGRTHARERALDDAQERVHGDCRSSVSPPDAHAARTPRTRTERLKRQSNTHGAVEGYDNDPSAGSPTETLLRLLLPLNDKVCASSHDLSLANQSRDHSPKSSPDHSIGRSDGRCVQRAGT